MARRRDLESRVTRETDRLIVARDAEERAARKETDQQIRDLERAKRAPLSQDGVGPLAKAIAGVDRDGDPNPVTPAHIVEARRQMREMRNNDINSQIEFLRNPEGSEEAEDPYAALEVGTVKEGKRYIGGNPGDPASWEDVGTSTVPESPQASAVNSDGYVTGRSGGQNKGVIGQRLGESFEALTGSAGRGLEAVAGAYSAITPDVVPMSDYPEYYGNYKQQ